MLASDNPTICGFEDNMFCGYTQDTTDTQGYNWSWKNGNTGTSFTGPTNDHTTNTLNGHYMYIETSTPRQPNDTTRFISPQYQVGTCLNLCFDRFNFEYVVCAYLGEPFETSKHFDNNQAACICTTDTCMDRYTL